MKAETEAEAETEAKPKSILKPTNIVIVGEYTNEAAI